MHDQMIQAPGVSDFFDVMFKHWGSLLKEDHEQRRKAREMNFPTEGWVTTIIDDDGDDLDKLENKSLEDAKNGIVVAEGFDLVDDGYGPSLTEQSLVEGMVAVVEPEADKPKSIEKMKDNKPLSGDRDMKPVASPARSCEKGGDIEQRIAMVQFLGRVEHFL